MKNKRHYAKRKAHRIKFKKPLLKKPLFWITISFTVIIFSLLYFILFSSELQVYSVLVSGNNVILGEDIENIAWNRISKKILALGDWSLISQSIFLVKTQKINNDILNKFYRIESVDTTKKNFHTLDIQIKERVPISVFCKTDAKECFYIDENGVIFDQIEQIPHDMLTIRQFTNDKIALLGEEIVDKSIIELILKIDESLKNNFQINIKEAIMPDSHRLNIETSENWQIYFSLEEEADLQITKLNLLLKDEISPANRKTLQYVDLRFKDRAYYK